MRYDHTQRAPIWLILLGIALLELVLAIVFKPLTVRIVLFALAGLFAFLAAAFAHLRVREEAEALHVAFGPLELASKRIPYDRILSVRRARSRLVDGWGIHWVPWRGWTWNLWGYDCVEIETRTGTLRVGTDDADGLVEHLASRTGA